MIKAGALIAGAVMAASSASADVPLAGKLPSDAELARYLIAQYAQCVVNDNHQRASAAVVADLTDEQLLFKYSDIFIKDAVVAVGQCPNLKYRLNGSVNLNGDHLRFALAEALVHSDLAKADITSFADKAPLAHRDVLDGDATKASIAATTNPAVKRKREQEYEVRVAWSWLSRFGECVARKDSPHSLALIATKADSTAENAAFGDLAPAMGACLDEGQKLDFPKPLLRGVIAVDYYRLALAPAVMAAGVGQ